MSQVTVELVGQAPRIAIERAGSGPVVVFLHGIGGNRTNWRDQLPVFAQEFEAVAWDARGYGDSEDWSGQLDFGDFARDLDRVLDHLGADRAHLVGLSMGGLIAQDYYFRYPERTASLTLCDTSPGISESHSEKEIEEFLAARQKPLLEGKEPADIAEGNARRLMSPASGEAIFQRLAESLGSVRKGPYLQALEATTRYKPLGRLEDVGVPSLIVCGADDPLTPASMSKDMHRRIPGARLAILEQAGHLSNIEQPDEFNRVVLDFLKSAEQDRRAA